MMEDGDGLVDGGRSGGARSVRCQSKSKCAHNLIDVLYVILNT